MTRVIFVTSQSSSTFGQTAAGCHSSVGTEQLITSCAMDASSVEKEAFMAYLRGRDSVTLEQTHRAVCQVCPPKGYGEVNKTMNDLTFEEFADLLPQDGRYGSRKNPQGDYIMCYDGWTRIFEADHDYVFEEASSTLDPDNLAYQKSLIS